MEAITETKPITVTLENRKVYIGLVYDSLEPGKEANLTILPLYSGYRDNETLEMKLTQKYTSVDALLGHLESGETEGDEIIGKLKEYRIVIPRERIVTLNLSVNSLRNTVLAPTRTF